MKFIQKHFVLMESQCKYADEIDQDTPDSSASRFNEPSGLNREAGVEQGRRKREKYPPALLKGASGGGGALFVAVSYVISWFIARSTRNKFTAAIRASRKFRIVFCKFVYYFWGQHCCWIETTTIDNHCFIEFPLPQLFYCRCSGVPGVENKLPSKLKRRKWNVHCIKHVFFYCL